MYQVSNESSFTEKEIEEFIGSSKGGNILQTKTWADFKSDNWESRRIVVTDQEGIIVGLASILFRTVAKIFKLAYIPRGFLCDYNNKELLDFMLDVAIKEAKKEGAFNLVVEPPIFRENFGDAFSAFTSKGFKHGGFGDGLSGYQPRFEMIVGIDRDFDDYVRALPSKERNKYNKALASGLEIIEVNDSLIATYERINRETEKRQGVNLRNENYFRRLYDYYKDSGKMEFVLVRLNRDKQLAFFDSKIKESTNARAKALEKLESLEEGTKKYNKEFNKIALAEKEIQGFERGREDVINTSDEDLYLAGAIVLYAGESANYIYAASTDSFRNLYPSTFMNVELIRRAMARGCTKYNMGGVHSLEDQNDGLYVFKKSMLGEPAEYIGHFECDIKFLTSKLYNFAFKVRKRI